jgi:predicted Zn-dependent peptidase
MTDRYQKTVLQNGIRIVTEQLSYTRSVTIGFWFDCGSRHEPSRLNGITHLMEHMLFKGTATRSAYDIAVGLEALGGQLNAYTEKEQTCFYAVVLDKDLPHAVDILSDIVQNALLRDDDLILEKEIVIDEYRSTLDAPDDFIHDVFASKIYQSHPLGAMILGSPESIKRIKRSHLKTFKEQRYTAGHLIIAAAGNLDHQNLVNDVKRHLSHFTTGQSAGTECSKPAAVVHYPAVNSVQVHLCMGTTLFGYSDPRKIALLAVHHFLGMGMSSLLFQELREKRALAYNIYSFTEFYSDTGLLGVYACTEETNKEKVKSLIQALVGQLKENGMTTAELERTKSQMTGGLLLGMEDTGHRMHRLAKMEVYLQDYVSISQVVNAIAGLTTGSILDMLTETGSVDEWTVAVLGPDEKP